MNSTFFSKPKHLYQSRNTGISETSYGRNVKQDFKSLYSKFPYIQSFPRSCLYHSKVLFYLGQKPLSQWGLPDHAFKIGIFPYLLLPVSFLKFDTRACFDLWTYLITKLLPVCLALTFNIPEQRFWFAQSNRLCILEQGIKSRRAQYYWTDEWIPNTNLKKYSLTYHNCKNQK